MLLCGVNGEKFTVGWKYPKDLLHCFKLEERTIYENQLISCLRNNALSIHPSVHKQLIRSMQNPLQIVFLSISIYFLYSESIILKNVKCLLKMCIIVIMYRRELSTPLPHSYGRWMSLFKVPMILHKEIFFLPFKLWAIKKVLDLQKYPWTPFKK